MTDRSAGRARRAQARARWARRGTVGLVLGAALAAGGNSYAYWSSLGTGAGTAGAAAGLGQFVTGTATADAAHLLYPGGPAVPLAVHVDNGGNSFPLRVSGVASDPSRTVQVDGAHSDCTTPDLTVATVPGLAIDVGPGGTADVLIPGVVSLGNASDTDCQGATFTIPITLMGQN